METITYNNKEIGQVYLGTHGAWVAQPTGVSYSCTFLTREAAILELIFHHAYKPFYEVGQGIPIN